MFVFNLKKEIDVMPTKLNVKLFNLFFNVKLMWMKQEISVD